MKLTTFTYTDSKNKTTHRNVAVITEASNKVSGLDITDMDTNRIPEFIEMYNKVLTANLERMAELTAEFGLEKSYRQFICSQMEDAVTDYL